EPQRPHRHRGPDLDPAIDALRKPQPARRARRRLGRRRRNGFLAAAVATGREGRDPNFPPRLALPVKNQHNCISSFPTEIQPTRVTCLRLFPTQLSIRVLPRMRAAMPIENPPAPRWILCLSL